MAHKGSENLKKNTFKDKKKASEAGKKSGRKRREKKMISDYMRDLLQQEFTLETKKGKKVTATAAEHIATSIVKKAMSGDLKAAKEYIDRIEGQALQKKEIKAEVNNKVSLDAVREVADELNDILNDKD